MRTLLLHTCGPKSFDDLKKVPGNPEPCQTFEEAARQRGLLKSNAIWIQTLIEAADEIQSNFKFRRYFASLIYNVAPPNPMEIFDQLLDRLWPSVPAHPDIAWRKEKALNHIEYVLRSLNTNFNTWG